MDTPHTRAGAPEGIAFRVLPSVLTASAFLPVKLEKRLNPLEHDRIVQSLQLQLQPLTTRTERVFRAVAQALVTSNDPAQGYRFRAAASRAEIARQLGKGGLVRYDIEMLRTLVAAGLVQERKRALPRRTVRGADGQMLQQGAGFEFVYSINQRVLYGLVALDNPQAFDQLDPDKVGTAMAAAKPMHQAPAPQPRRSGFTDTQRLVLGALVIGVLALVVVIVMLIQV